MGNEALPLMPSVAEFVALLLLLAVLVLASSGACVMLAAGVTALLVAFAASAAAEVALLMVPGTAVSTVVTLALLMLRAASTPGNAGVSAGAGASACPATGVSNEQLTRQITASKIGIRMLKYLAYLSEC
jgi:hypothetical protein